MMEGGGGSAETELYKQELHPLQIGNIMENILSNLDIESIKSARQINELWSAEGAKLLISKCFVKIPSDLQTEDWESKDKEMDEFKAFLSHKASETSMIPNIKIGAAGDFELWKTLGILGPEVKSVKLEFMDKNADLLPSLLDLLPNLNLLDLQLDNFWYNRTAIINGITSVMSKKETDGNKLLIPRMTLNPCFLEDLEAVEKFADCSNIMLQDVKVGGISYELRHLPNLNARFASMWAKILHTSRNVLKNLDLEVCGRYLIDIKFPCMTALTTMILDFRGCRSEGLQRKFAPSFRFSEKLPNLYNIVIHYYSSSRGFQDRDFFQYLFETTGTAPTVKRLELRNPLSDWANIDPLLKTFPNIEELDTCTTHTFGFFPSFWTNETVVNLKKLYLRVDLDKLDDLDSIFTGFSPGNVRGINKEPNLDFYTLEELRELYGAGPSILNLKELEHLTISFEGHRKQLPENMLVLSWKYAFSVMPKDLKVFIDPGYFSLHGASVALKEVSKLSNVTVLTPILPI